MATKKHHGNAIVKYLGPSAELPIADLPTLRDVFKQCQLLRERHVGPTSSYKLETMAADVVPLILNIWRRANAKLVEIPIRNTEFALEIRIV